MKAKDIQQMFTQAPWRATAGMRQWTQDVGAQPPPVIEKLLEIVVDNSRREDPAESRRNRRRLTAFEEILDQSVGPALFPILVNGLADAEPATRQVLVARIPACNDPSQHRMLVKLLEHPDDSIRAIAVATLRELESSTAFPFLAAAVKDPRLAGRKEAVDLMCEFGGTRALTGLVSVLRQGRDADRAHAVQKLGDPMFTAQNLHPILETLRALFADPADAVVVRAVEVFSRLCSAEQAQQNLLPGLKSPRIPVVKAIVRSLARFPGPNTLALLEQRFAAGPLAVRVAVLETCEEIGDDRVVPLVFDALASGQFAVRDAAAGILSRLSEREDVDIGRAIAWLLRNPEASVRRRAVEVAAQTPEADSTLWRQLLPSLSDPDWWVRERAVDVVTERGGEDLVPELGRILSKGDPVARVYAIDICERLKTEASLALLLRTLNEDTELQVRDRTVEALGSFVGVDAATMAVVEVLRSTPALAHTAVEALGNLGATKSASLIADQLKSTDNALVDVALRTLDAFDDPEQSAAVEACVTHRRARVRTYAAELVDRWTNDSLPRVDTLFSGDNPGSLEGLLRHVLDAEASTLVLASGARPLLKHQSASATLGEAPYSAERIKRMVLPVLTAHQRARLEQGHEADTSYAVGSERFRAHIFPQRVGLTAIFHRSRTKIENLDELGLPPALASAARWRSGLLVLAGEPRSGRSTTMHAVIDRINATSTRHVIQLAPALEVVHAPKKSVVTQREIGSHAAGLGLALRASLRQDPDVIALDDVPGDAAIAFALGAAETGHLVICTVVAQSAGEAVERLFAGVPKSELEHARAKVATTLRAVVCQRLLPRINGEGRVAASELLLRTPAVSNLIRKGKLDQLPTAITTGQQLGMVSFERDLERLVRAGAIDAA